MNSYPDALYAMHELLGALGENHWLKWIAQDIVEWEDRHSVAHHLSAYGGMGSFNDIGFEDVWLGSCFYDLRSICYHLAKHPVGNVNISTVRDSMSGLGLEISGWRCLSCGYGAVSTRDIDCFIARRVVRDAILEALKNGEIREFVHSIVGQRPSANSLSSDAVMDWLTKGGIHIREASSWLRPCPSCNSDNTAVYRWQFSKEDGGKFIPSSDNLPIRHVPSSK